MQQLGIFGIVSSAIFVYANIFSNFSLDSILAQIQLIVIIKTVYFVVSSLLPIQGIVNTIFQPFTYMHKIFHVHAAKKLNEKHRDETGRPGKEIRMNLSLGDSSIRNEEYSNISFMVNGAGDMSIRDIMYFANSSTVPAFVMLLAIVSLGPLMQTLLFALIHLYIVCGITLCLMPSKADSRLITNFILVKTQISAWYVANIFIVFFLSASCYGLKYYYMDYYPSFWFVEPFLMGIWSVLCYVFLLSLVIMLTEEPELYRKEEYKPEDLEKLPLSQEDRLKLNRLFKRRDERVRLTAATNEFDMLSELESK